MGGELGVHVRCAAHHEPDAARRDALRVAARMGAWADRLTRFSDTSDLVRLNDDRRARVPVRPTLAALLEWSRRAADLTAGIVDVTLLDARLAAESPAPAGVRSEDADAHRWALQACRFGAIVRRWPGLRFDLDGVGKGWLADRGVALLERYPAAVVNADGDVALALRADEAWRIEIANPADPRTPLATLELVGLDPARSERIGLATSGTSVHRWQRPDGPRHHLIDPRTGHPAVTDIVQATVLAGSAAAAEAFAKALVILGSQDALRLLERPEQRGAVLLTKRGEILATPAIQRWLA